MAGEFIPSGVELIARNLGQFLSDLNTANKAIASIGVGAGKEATAALKTLVPHISSIGAAAASTAGVTIGAFQSIGSSILGIGATAAKVAVGGVAILTAGLVTLGAMALGEFAKYERMALSIENLTARSIAQGKVVETQRQVLVGMTKQETEELAGLAQKIKDEELDRATLAARIKEQSEALRQLRNEQGEGALSVQTATARLNELENEYNKSGTAIQTMKDRVVELSGKEGELVTVTEKVRTGQMSMNEAMELAGPKAKELLNWVTKLALQSPFDEAGVNTAFQTALAYGFNIDMAKRLTEAELDYAAASGKSVDALNLVALALGQMQAKGKVSGQEIIQLTNAGIGVNKILEDMGFTLDDVSNGLVDADDFIEAVIQDMEIFKGAGAAQASTFSGLLNSLGDLKAIGLREFFAGTFTAIQPYLTDFVGMLSSAALETGSLRALGDVMGTTVANGIKTASDFISGLWTNIQKVTGAFEQFGARGAAVSILGILGLDQDQLATIMPVIDSVILSITKITTAFENFGARGAAVSIMGQLGLDPESIAFILSAVDSVISKITEIGSLDTVLTFVAENFEAIKGAIIGIGAVAAGGVFVAIVAGIASLITPVTLLVAGAALLGAAWAGNWGGIRDTTMQVWAAIQPTLSTLVEWLQVAIPVALQIAADYWTNVLVPAFKLLGDYITNVTIPVLSTIGEWLQTNVPIAVQAASDAWTNTLMPAIRTAMEWMDANVIPIFVTIGEWLQTNIPIAVQTASDVWSNTLLPALQDFDDFAKQNILPLMASIGRVMEEVVNKALTAQAGLWKNVLLPAANKVASLFSDTLMPAITDIATAIGDWLMPHLEDMAGDGGLLTMLSEGLETVVQWIKEATSWFNSLADAVSDFELPDVLTPGSPPPFAYALQDIALSAEAAEAAVTNFISATAAGANLAGGSIQSAIFGNLGLDAGTWIDETEMGEDERNAAEIALTNTYNRLFEAIKDGNAGVGELMQDFRAQLTPPLFNPTDISAAISAVDFQEIVDTIQQSFGPMTLALKEQIMGVAQNLAGLGVSFADLLADQMGSMEEAQAVYDDYAKEIDKITKNMDKMTISLGKAQEKSTELTQDLANEVEQHRILAEELDIKNEKINQWTLELDALVAAGEGQSEQADKLRDKIRKEELSRDKLILRYTEQEQKIADITKALEAQTQAAADLQAQLDAAAQAQEELNAKALEEAFATLTQGHGGIAPFAKLTDQIAALQAFLASDETALTGQVWDDALGEWVNWSLDRVTAQNLLNEALAEQAELEEEIRAAQEAQQQLSFLQMQLDLIKAFAEIGAEVPAGLTFGLDASTADMLAAINALSQAMVAELDESLGISSPSKVAAEKAEFFVAGFVNKLDKLVPSVKSMMGNMFDAGSILFPRMQPSNTSNYNFNMTVNTGASPQAVIQQYEVARSLLGV